MNEFEEKLKEAEEKEQQRVCQSFQENFKSVVDPVIQQAFEDIEDSHQNLLKTNQTINAKVNLSFK